MLEIITGTIKGKVKQYLQNWLGTFVLQSWAYDNIYLVPFYFTEVQFPSSAYTSEAMVRSHAQQTFLCLSEMNTTFGK